MVCAACGYIYDPTKGTGDVKYSTEFYSELGGVPFISSDDLPGVFACPVCGTLKLDVAGGGLTAPAPKESGAAPETPTPGA